MALLLRVHRSGQDFALLVEVARRVEMVGVKAVHFRIAIKLPDVRDDNGPLRDEVAFIEVVFNASVTTTSISD